jgi:hypothetical protein
MLFWNLVSEAQTNAVARLDTSSILIGDQVNLVLSITVPNDFQVEFPVFTDTIISQVEVVKQSFIDSSYNKAQNEKLYRQVLTITSFDSGYWAIPPFRFNYKKPGDKMVQFAETEALLLEVQTIPVDMQKDVKDIKGPVEAPFTFREALPYILIFLAVAAAALILIYFIRKRKRAEPVFRMVAKPKVPPHQIALEQLESLRFKKLWQNGMIKEYHTELVDIIRTYLTGKFEIHALEFTSDEIMTAVDGTPANKQANEKLRNTLILADMVKFAKAKPMPLEHDASLNNAIDFVKETSHLGVVQDEKITKEQQPVNSTEPQPIMEEMEGKEVKDVQ